MSALVDFGAPALAYIHLVPWCEFADYCDQPRNGIPVLYELVCAYS